MELANHTLTAGDFTGLATGSGNSGTLERLSAAELSRRFVLFRLLFDLLVGRPGMMGPLPPIDHAWEALEDAQASSPETVATVLLSPQLGVWLSRMIRILRTGEVDPEALWPEIGHVHAVAFAAAVRSGTTLSTSIPVRDGNAMVPTLGMAHLPLRGLHVAAASTSRGRARIRCGEHDIPLPADPTVDEPSWWSLRTVPLRQGELALDLVIDDIDGYRNFDSPIAPRRLDEESHAGWAAQLADAWQILVADWPAQAEAMTAGFLSVAPLPRRDGRELRTASTGDAFGAALISPHPDAVSLAMSLVHEFQHIKLGSLVHLIPLVEPAPDDDRELVYAPWRDDPRPVPGLLQGVYAFSGIAEFWRRHRRTAPLQSRALADFEFAYALRQARRGLTTVLGSSLLTPHGREFGELLGRRLRDHLADHVPVTASRAAWAAATEHHAAWRIRHLRPDPTRTAKLVDAYLAGAAARSAEPVPGTLSTAEKTRWHQTRLALHRLRLSQPAEFTALLGGDGPMPPQALGAMRADLLLVDGDPVGAQRGYLAMIAEDPASVAGWSGLAVTAAATSTGGWRVLARRPELVRAVYREAGRRAAPTPVAIAEWLGRAPVRWLNPVTT